MKKMKIRKNEAYFKTTHQNCMSSFECCHKHQPFISKAHSRHLCLAFPQESNVQALEILLTYHGSHLLPHRLAILSNFPETTSPHEYAVLLPEAWYVTLFYQLWLCVCVYICVCACVCV